VTRGARLAAWLYGIAAITYLLDRVTKIWAERVLATRPPMQILSGVLQLNYTTNSGGAFSIGGSAPWVFAGASVVVIALIIVASFRIARPAFAVALGLILGGAVGNLTDRVVRGPGLTGRVVDFIDLHVWPVFNIADSAIVLGAAILLVSSLTGRDRGGPDGRRPGEDAPRPGAGPAVREKDR
jgi:signal peptidase II